GGGVIQQRRNTWYAVLSGLHFDVDACRECADVLARVSRRERLHAEMKERFDLWKSDLQRGHNSIPLVVGEPTGCVQHARRGVEDDQDVSRQRLGLYLLAPAQLVAIAVAVAITVTLGPTQVDVAIAVAVTVA